MRLILTHVIYQPGVFFVLIVWMFKHFGHFRFDLLELGLLTLTFLTYSFWESSDVPWGLILKIRECVVSEVEISCDHEPKVENAEDSRSDFRNVWIGNEIQLYTQKELETPYDYMRLYVIFKTKHLLYSWTTFLAHVILQKTKVYWTSVFFDSFFGCLDVHPSIGSLTLQD